MRWVVIIFAAACGGEINEKDGGDDASAPEVAVGDGADSMADAPDASPCQSTSSGVTHDDGGGCKSAYEDGVCGNDILEVDCLCSIAKCYCRKNGKQTAMVDYDCASCLAVGPAWQACGFE